MRFLKIPSTDEEEIKKILKIESVKYLPYADEDIIYGWRLIEKTPDGYSIVSLAIVQAETVNRFMTILTQADLKLESISTGSETLYLWYLTASQTKDDLDLMLVNMASDYVDIDIIRSGRLAFTRGVVLEKGAFRMDKVIAEIRISNAAYQKEVAKGVDKIILTGVRERLKESEVSIKDAFKLPTEVMDQLENIPIAESADINLDEVSFVELLGLSLAYKDVKINLLPEAQAEEKRVRLSKKNFIYTLILIGLIIVTASGLFVKKLHDKTVYLSYIDRELTDLEPKVSKTKKMMKDINLVTDQAQAMPLAIDIITEIHKITPGGISLSMLDYEGNKSFSVRGSALSLSGVFKYVSVLEASPYFRNVKVKYANKRIVEGQEIADFEINCLLSQAK